ncbi:ligase-associated DNA damage response endonuclease PdeM [Novosphingobium sp. ERN07]|uniref:ligase-associated DNA damage response endonuclease PdeM n=1 Tax=Novosphingobium sp. ERN07 TaxID=2726187 RepID=UPI001456FA16|nr:ligase-associated DNA damage response endonuclease PdeM [Novosphingobium sp. ERN07]NLR72488.1 ligase-associated DNA damage response endonuclease PdeM [Novosphingobium sp. ERN07]
MVPFSFASQEFRLGPSRAVFWAEENALLVADLHLEKASFFARHGQMLPPYDSRATLERLADALRHTGARRVFCLGDSFHDAAAVARMEPHAAGMLDALTRTTDWVWITGNHDEDAAAPGGTLVDELDVRGIKLRHIARKGSAEAEVSGHFHPKLRVSIRGRSIARPCAVASENRLILPAFGALTGGMDAGDPAILAALQPARAIDAIVPAGAKLARFALWRQPV